MVGRGLVDALPGPLQALLRRIHNLRGLAPADLADPAFLRRYWRVAPHTVVRWRKLRHLDRLASEIVRAGPPGAFVECGVGRGGCAALMALHAALDVHGRVTWLFDSFEGLPEPSEADGAAAIAYAGGRAGGALRPIGRCVGPLAEVAAFLFGELGLDEARVRLVPGWFQETLPATRAAIGPIALLRLDGDWYDSTRTCLEQLYDQVVPGGRVVIDDYGDWEGCRRATDEFLAARGLAPALLPIDRGGRWFVKPGP
jgi:hypothetical protein